MKHPIVILHGWGLSANVFSPLARELARNHLTVFAPDLPGFGDSIIPDHALKLEDYVHFLEEYFKKNNIEKPVLIGHSFGGRVALRYSLSHPENLTTLVLTGTPGFTPVPKKKLALFISVAKIGKLFFLIPFTSAIRDHVRQWYYYVVGARDYYRAQGVMKDTFKNIVAEELKTSMEHVRVPALLIWGADDIIVPVSVARRMKETIPGASLTVVPSVGHGLPYKHPKDFCVVLLSWMKSL